MTEVEIPDRFSPSRLARLAQCPLSVIAKPSLDDDLPAGPAAGVGTAIHGVVEAYRRGKRGTEMGTPAEVDACLGRETDRIEERLRVRLWTATMVPLARAIGRKKWLEKRGSLVRWVRGFVADRPPSIDPPEHDVDLSWMDDDYRPIAGPEVALDSTSLRLRGKADAVVALGGGRYEVRDYKSGRIGEADDVPMEHRLQLGAYALVVETEPQAQVVRLVLEGESTIEIAWDDDARQWTRDRLHEMFEVLPGGARVPASTLARPGEHCRLCSIRPRCASYLAAAPTWWRDPETRAPYDIWGTPSSVEVSGGEVAMWLHDGVRPDAARVTGLALHHGLQKVPLGDPVWLFGLANSETRYRGHPHNLHERQGDDVSRRAWGTRVFGSSGP